MTKADFAQRCIRHIDDAPCGSNIDTEEPIEGHTRFHFKLTIKTATHWLTAYSTITIFLAWFFFVVDYKDPYHSYGTKCNVVQKQFMYVDGLPSLLNLSQLRAFPNYMMRLGILPTMLIRVFFVCVERWRKHIVEPASLSGKGLRNRLHNLLPALHAVEVFCLSMILILHCKYDHLGFYSVYSICFTASSLLVMGITVYLSALKPDGQFTKDERRFLQISLICLFCYAGSAPLVMDKHLDFVKFFTCSYLVSHIYFFLELVSILSYGAFHYFYCVINIGELEMCVFSEAVELPDEYLTCTPDSSMASSSELRSNEISMFRLSSRQSSLGRNSRNRLTL